MLESNFLFEIHQNIRVHCKSVLGNERRREKKKRKEGAKEKEKCNLIMD